MTRCNRTICRDEQYEVDDKEKQCVNIMRFGMGRHCVYWIGHPDFPAGYFGTMKAAKQYAELMYG
jgi:hypothetical protein